MTNCDAVRELLCERLDGALDALAEGQVEQHLVKCTDCRDVGARLASVVADLALLSDVGMPHGLGERIAARVPAPVRPRLSLGGAGADRHDVRRVAGWAVVMITMALAILGRGISGRVADGVAPLLAEARQQALRSELGGEGLLARLDSGAERGLDRIAAAALNREK